jgi:hypothetical protein
VLLIGIIVGVSVHVIDTPKRVKLTFQAGTGWVSLGFFKTRDE